MYKGIKKGRNGIGFMIKPHLKNNIQDFIAYSDRVARIDLKFEHTTLNIIQVYAPTEKATDKEISLFYKDIESALKGTNRDTILMGDFNAKIGWPTKEEYLICGPNGYGDRNERGSILINFCFQYQLHITNTLFKKNEKQKWTWISPDGKHKNEIDFILVKTREKVQNNEVINTKFPSDHRLVRITYSLDTNIRRNRKKFTVKSKNFTEIEAESLKNMAKEIMHTIYSEDIDETYKKTIQTIKGCVEDLPVDKENTKDMNFITEEIKILMEERHRLKNVSQRTPEQKKTLKRLYKKISKKIKEVKNKKKLETLEKELELRSSTKHTIKRFGKGKEWITSLSKNITNRQEILEEATSFYRNLYSNKDKPISSTLSELDFLTDETVPSILNREVENAIEQLKKEKSSGEDGITNDIIKAMVEPLTPHLTKLFNSIIIQEKIPNDWKESIITLIYKKGDPLLIDNYRPICLLPTIYKLFSKVLLNRMSAQLEEQQPREQAGFRKGFSTTDHIFTVTQVMEKFVEHNKILYLAFVDYTKAFDSISHECVWNCLREQGIHTKYINILQTIYKETQAKVKLERVGTTFPINRGVKQGDPISPKLFTALLETIFRNMNIEDQSFGININGERLTHLRFADDIVILAENHEDIQAMLTKLDTESQKVGLYMNPTKTKVMTNGITKPIYIDSGIIDYVPDYIYLGQTISFQNPMNKEIDRRIASAWKRYWSNKDVFKSNLPVNLKKKIMDNTILPALLYGCQTWSLTKNIVRKIITFQRATERSMLGLKLQDRVKNTEIRRITKITDAVDMLCRLKWKWAGHVARTTDGRWSERILHWYPRDTTRPPGRPKRRWCDDIVEIAGNTWTRRAKDRRDWQTMEEAYTQLWVTK